MPHIASRLPPGISRACRVVACCAVVSWAVAAAAERTPPPQAFVAKTFVIVPKRVGGFVLEGTTYDPAAKYSGVGARYVDPDHKAVRIDVYVYPAGKLPQAEAVERGMAPFRDSLEEGERLGYHKQVEIQDEAPFAIALRSPLESARTSASTSAASQPQPETAPATKASASDAGLLPPDLMRLLEPEPLQGRRLKLTYVYEPGAYPMRSRGYLFHKQLYFFKGRISATTAAIDEAPFSELADRAITQLVPAIDALNVGACGNLTIGVDPKASKQARSDRMTAALLTGLVSTASDNCSTAVPDDLDARRANAEVVEIDFDPDDWTGR